MRDELAFSSKVDLGLLILVLTVVAICLWLLGANWRLLLGAGWFITALVAIPLVIGIVLPLWFVTSLRYFLSDDTLRVRCGPLHWRIRVGDIRAVEPTRNASSGPALSLDRLRIETADGETVLISPEPRQEFLRQLEHRRAQAA